MCACWNEVQKTSPSSQETPSDLKKNILSKYADVGKLKLPTSTSRRVFDRRTRDPVAWWFISEINLPIPDFALEPESFGTKFSELVGGKDIDFG